MSCNKPTDNGIAGLPFGSTKVPLEKPDPKKAWDLTRIPSTELLREIRKRQSRLPTKGAFQDVSLEDCSVVLVPGILMGASRQSGRNRVSVAAREQRAREIPGAVAVEAWIYSPSRKVSGRPEPAVYTYGAVTLLADIVVEGLSGIVYPSPKFVSHFSVNRVLVPEDGHHRTIILTSPAKLWGEFEARFQAMGSLVQPEA